MKKTDLRGTMLVGICASVFLAGSCASSVEPSRITGQHDPRSKASDRAGKHGYAVDEIADKAVADRAAFMGKEVAVYGYIAHQPRLKDGGFVISLMFDPTVHKERQLSCVVPQSQLPNEISENWKDKYVTVKGKVANIHSQNYMDLRSVVLEPCEITN